MKEASNGPAMTRIDGRRVREIREQKGLTQLYLATVIGVTTDTVSRWENRRYPSIKQENAEKLARALEVELRCLLEEEAGTGPADTPAPDAGVGRARRSRMLISLLILILTGIFWFYLMRPDSAPDSPQPVTARRFLPSHVPAGQTFPVLIKIEAAPDQSQVIILRENLPPGCKVVAGAPDFIRVNERGRLLKWIGRPAAGAGYFGYLVRSPSAAGPGRELIFSGNIHPGTGMAKISGPDRIRIAPFHWADLNRDLRIDDEEILAVYELFGNSPDFDYGRELVDELWAADGYRWDGGRGEFREGP